MCFSPEISFTTAAVITGVGVIGFRKAKLPATKYLALIPLFFGMQQFMEGLVWLSLENEILSHWTHPASIGFLIFAWVVWPLVMPFVLGKNEKHPPRKKILTLLTYVGMAVSILCAYALLDQKPVGKVMDHSIYYPLDRGHPLSLLLIILYLLTTLVPALISSIPKMWLVGFINLVSYAFIKIYFHDHVISLWCFFGALVSGLILWIILDMRKPTSH